MPEEIGKKEKKVNWASLIKKEDWIAVWIGFILITLVVTGIVLSVPKISGWSNSLYDVIQLSNVLPLVFLAIGITITATIAVRLIEGKVGTVWKGIPVIFALSIIAFVIAGQETIKYYGLEYVLWALLIGLFISNIIGTPKWLKASVRTELFIKIGLVLLGANIIFTDLLKGGAIGMIQAIIGMMITFYFCYFLATKTGINKSFASIMASGVSICGVSAAIAAGGAIKGDKKEISYVISMVLLTSVIMLIGEPILARVLNLPSAVAGAWIGGTIDTTGAVIAAGELIDETAFTTATIVKLAQNVLIGIAAFVLAIYWTLKVDAKPDEKPKVIDIWYRFPKFIVGFIITSIIFSFVLNPALGETAIGDIGGVVKGFRKWFFAMSFVCIGLETKVADLLKVGGKKAALVYTSAQLLNIVLVYALSWIFFGGIFFPPPV